MQYHVNCTSYCSPTCTGSCVVWPCCCSTSAAVGVFGGGSLAEQGLGCGYSASGSTLELVSDAVSLVQADNACAFPVARRTCLADALQRLPHRIARLALLLVDQDEDLRTGGPHGDGFFPELRQRRRATADELQDAVPGHFRVLRQLWGARTTADFLMGMGDAVALTDPQDSLDPVAVRRAERIVARHAELTAAFRGGPQPAGSRWSWLQPGRVPSPDFSAASTAEPSPTSPLSPTSDAAAPFVNDWRCLPCAHEGEGASHLAVGCRFARDEANLRFAAGWSASHRVRTPAPPFLPSAALPSLPIDELPVTLGHAAGQDEQEEEEYWEAVILKIVEMQRREDFITEWGHLQEEEEEQEEEKQEEAQTTPHAEQEEEVSFVQHSSRRPAIPPFGGRHNF